MIKIRRKTKRKILILVIFVVVISVGVLYINNNNENKPVKSEYEIELEKELDEVNSFATKAWSKAIKNGKKDKDEILEYIKISLKQEGLNPDDYYYTLSMKGVKVAKKHVGLVVESGYYKSGTNFQELIKDWNQLINTRGINVVDGRLGALRNETEKVDVVIDKSVTEIKEKVVAKDLKIGSIIIPDSVTTLSTIAFQNANIEEIVLNTKLSELDGHFKDLSSLKKITFTGDVKVIKRKTFSNTNIEEINFIGSIEQLVSIKYVTYFDVPTHYKESTLYINGVLVDEIVIPEGVTEIKDFAIHNYTNIKKVTIPSSVTFIGTRAVIGKNLKKVVYNGTKEMWEKVIKMEEWIFNEIDCTVYCTDGNIVYVRGE